MQVIHKVWIQTFRYSQWTAWMLGYRRHIFKLLSWSEFKRSHPPQKFKRGILHSIRTIAECNLVCSVNHLKLWICKNIQDSPARNLSYYRSPEGLSLVSLILPLAMDCPLLHGIHYSPPTLPYLSHVKTKQGNLKVLKN